MPDNFLQLKDIWNKKLAESGFIDAEDNSHPDSPLKAWHSFKWSGLDQHKFESTNQYYTKALELLNTYSFDNKTHKRIWELHCNGLSKRKIEKAILHLSPNYKREQIGNIIKLIAAGIL